MAFFVAMEQKIALNPFGGTLGETGVREKSFLRARVQFSGLARLASFYSISVPRVQFFSGVRHVCHDNDGSFGDADPGIPGYKH